MDINSIPLFSMLRSRLGYLTQREQLISQNVANSDTPNYKARDLKEFTFSDTLKQATVSPVTTNPMHMVGNSARGATAGTVVKDKSYEVLPSGNSVVMEDQMMKVASNNADYQLATNIYRKMTGLFRTALGRGSS